MAVTQSGNKVVLFGAAADAVTGRLEIQRIDWVKPTTAGDDLVISDSKEKVIWMATASVANGDRSVEFPRGFWVNGITITTLDHGTVNVTLY